MADKNECGTQGISRRHNMRRARLGLTMRLSDAGMRQRQTELIYFNHRLPPWHTEDAARDRSNRLLDATYLALALTVPSTLQTRASGA
jgi:hypothetical protein